MSSAIIFFILLFLTTYQASQGSYFWSYVAQVAVDTANSIASMVLWSGVLTMALFSQYLFDELTILGTFYMFFGINSIGGIFVLLFMKETRGLSREQ